MLSTDEMMQLANQLIGAEQTPADSAIYVTGQNIKRALFGIDINSAHLLLAKQLGFDAVIAHHPYDRGLLSWPVYLKHIDLMVKAGVPQVAAEAAVLPRIEMLRQAGHSVNNDEVPSTARLLGMPFLNVHNVCDELGRRELQRVVDETIARNGEDTLLDDIVGALNQSFGEFGQAAARIEVMLGETDDYAGKTVVAHGAYTNGGSAVAAAYFRHGVDTLLYIHILPDELKKLKDMDYGREKGRLIVVGHLAADSIGMNVYIRELEKHGVEVTRCSGALEP